MFVGAEPMANKRDLPRVFLLPGTAFTAKYPGKCGLCGKRFCAGERICGLDEMTRAGGKSKGYAHEACAAAMHVPALLSDDERKFANDLCALGCSILFDEPGVNHRTPSYKREFPIRDWIPISRGNQSRLQALSAPTLLDSMEWFLFGGCVCANTGDAVVVLDVNPDMADVDAVRKSLDRSGTRAFAEVITPGGGRHLYLAGGSEMPRTVRGGLRGIQLRSHKACVYLPGTLRPKYHLKGYEIVFNDLDTLRSLKDYGGATAFEAWITQQKASDRQRARATVGRHAAEPSSAGLPDQGTDRPGGRADGCL
jgi:hypothetical protein